MPQDNVGNIREEALEPLKVYWQPGCSSCLKTKEFLLEHGVAFQSVNVLEDDSGFEELRALGLKLVPIVARGKNWANGAVFRDVARVAGFEYGGHKMLPPEEIKNKMIEIINEKVDTYSTLALYYLLDNNLITDQVKVDELFDKVISINKDVELKNLVIFKKGLYFSDKLEESELLIILNPIINSESIWKQHALLLMGDFYFYKKQFNKSKEFFSKIIELKNVNPKIKTDVEKRLNRDFSE